MKLSAQVIEKRNEKHPPREGYLTTLILSLLVILYLINGVCSINTLSVTSDENSHLIFGIRILKGNPVRPNPVSDNSKMPISVLNAIPRAAEQLFSTNLTKADYGISDVIHGRYITLIFSVLIILLVFQWSRKLYSSKAGLFSAFLFTLCPNNMANAVLTTTDTYAVFFLLATMYFLWRYCNCGSARHFTWLAVLLGLSQLAKQSLFHLYILVPFCLLIYVIVNKEKVQLVPVLRKLLITVSISWVIINTGFIFWHLNIKLGEYQFMSLLFQKVQALFPGNLWVPFSKSFITGLDQAKYYDQLGGGSKYSSFGNVTILGHSSTGGYFWYYYFVTIFFKTPITYLILLLWSVYLLYKRTDFTRFVKNEFFLMVPIVYYLLLMSFFYKTQCGIRHIIFIYPMLIILFGIVVQYAVTKKEQVALFLLSAFLVISVSRYFNNYYPYTNEFILHKKNAYRYVGASNLNFNQAIFLLQDYLQKHPGIKPAPEYPKTGKFVLITDSYLDIWNTGQYQWIRKLKPIGHVHYSYLLFDVRESDINP